MNKAEFSSPPWGAHCARGVARLLFLPVRLGISGGALRKALQEFYISRFGDVLDIERFGVKWRLRDEELKMAFRSKEYDKREIAAVLAAAQANGVFVDVGANIGDYTSRIARRFAGGGRVISLEPNPAACERLRFHIEANNLTDKVTVLPLCIGEKEEEAWLSFDSLSDGSLVMPGKSKQIKVSVRPLLDVLVEQNIEKIDALKIDIEGGEDRALMPFFQNAPRAMWPRCIVMEVVHRQHWKADVVVHILNLGYKQIHKTRSGNGIFHLTESAA